MLESSPVPQSTPDPPPRSDGHRWGCGHWVPQLDVGDAAGRNVPVRNWVRGSADSFYLAIFWCSGLMC